MGSRGDRGASGSDAGFENSVKKNKNRKNKFTKYTKDVTNPSDDTEAKMDLFYEQGVTNIKNSKFKTPATSLLTVPLQAGSRATRKFFADEVLGKGAYKNTSRDQFGSLSRTEQEDMYKTYVNKRTSGQTDSYGREISQSTLGRRSQKSIEQPKVASQMDNTGVKSDLINADQTAPTNVEMTDGEYNLATKRKGRKRTVLTSVTGDTSKATLSKKTLLGT